MLFRSGASGRSGVLCSRVHAGGRGSSVQSSSSSPMPTPSTSAPDRRRPAAVAYAKSHDAPISGPPRAHPGMNGFGRNSALSGNARSFPETKARAPLASRKRDHLPSRNARTPFLPVADLRRRKPASFVPVRAQAGTSCRSGLLGNPRRWRRSGRELRGSGLPRDG